jgi:electron transfer flavoprotein alpha subunit
MMNNEAVCPLRKDCKRIGEVADVLVVADVMLFVPALTAKRAR